MSKITVREAGLAIDYAAKFLEDVFAEKLRLLGYEDFPFDWMATGLFQYLLSREFVISRTHQESIADL